MKTTGPPALEKCSVCGGTDFQCRKVLWEELIRQWELSPQEAAYVDDQQGLRCRSCGCNLRSMTLAGAILSFAEHDGNFRELCEASRFARHISVLEINGAGDLTPFLSRFPRHELVGFPEIDMHGMPGFADASFDLLVHSDTLEHLRDPIAALRECRRLLRPRGALIYTVPVIVGRLTRRRDHLPDSYHGDPESRSDDLRVISEYGADFWCQPMSAGFQRIELHSLLFPHSVALLAHA